MTAALRMRADAAGDRVLIEVADKCGGLPPGDAEKMFAPFAKGCAAGGSRP
jgi:C4-dicarboxylate-specific signal transduction histidine kinase